MPEHLLKKMEHLELNGMFVPKNYGGADLMNTEALRLFQEMGKSFSLAELFRYLFSLWIYLLFNMTF